MFQLKQSVVLSVGMSLALIVMLIAGALFVTGCTTTTTQRQHVSVSVSDYRLIDSGFSGYIEQANPTLDIEWIVGKDDIGFYQDQANEGSLPDLIMVNTFDGRLGSELSSRLQDVSGELNAEYASIVQDMPGNQDGIKWVAAQAGFEGILANEYLFEVYGLELPTTRDEFIAACEVFEAQGARGFVAGYADDATLNKVLQGLAVDSFASDTARSWLESYDAGTSNTLDQEVWTAALGQFGEYLSRGIIRIEDLTLTQEQAEQMLIDGEVAMIFVSSSDVATYASDYNMSVRALPFYGSDAAAYVMAEPLFYAAVSEVATEGVELEASLSPQKEAAIAVLNTMMTPEGQAAYCEATGERTAVSLQHDVAIELPEALQLVVPYIEQGSLYYPLRIAGLDTGFIRALQSQQGGYDVQAVYQALNQELENSARPGEIVAHFGEAVSNIWSDTSGNQAASSIAQVVAQQTEADVVIMSPYSAQSPLYAGDKTLAQLQYPVPANEVYSVSLSGAELFHVLSELVGTATSTYEIPVVSGVSMDITHSYEGYALAALRTQSDERTPQEGAPVQSVAPSAEAPTDQNPEIDPAATYQVLVSGYANDSYTRLSQERGFALRAETLQELWSNYFTGREQANLPHSRLYFTLL